MATAPVVIEQVLGRSCQGVTQPFICVGDDGETYYVKGAGAGRRSLVSEWVADDVPAQVSWDAITNSLERCRSADFWNLP